MDRRGTACLVAGAWLAALAGEPARAFFFIEVSASCWPVDSCYTPTATIDLELEDGSTRTLAATSVERLPGYEPSCYFFHFSYEDPELLGAYIPFAHFSLVCAEGWSPAVAREYETQTVTCGWYWIPVFCHPVVPCEAFAPWPGCEVCDPSAFRPHLAAALQPDHCLLLSWTRHPDPGLFQVETAVSPAGPWSLLAVTPDTSWTVDPAAGRACFRVTQLFE